MIADDELADSMDERYADLPRLRDSLPTQPSLLLDQLQREMFGGLSAGEYARKLERELRGFKR